MPVLQTHSIPQLLGPVPAVLLLGLVAAVLALFAWGLFRKIRGENSRAAGWWLRRLAAGLLLLGVVLFAFAQLAAYLQVGAEMGADDVRRAMQAEAFARLGFFSASALLAWTSDMLLGRPKP